MPIAPGLNVDRMASAKRRACAFTNTARIWHAFGYGPQAFAALRRVEQEAELEFRRLALRALTSDLLYARMPGPREFALRTGAVPA